MGALEPATVAISDEATDTKIRRRINWDVNHCSQNECGSRDLAYDSHHRGERRAQRDLLGGRVQRAGAPQHNDKSNQ